MCLWTVTIVSGGEGVLAWTRPAGAKEGPRKNPGVCM